VKPHRSQTGAVLTHSPYGIHSQRDFQKPHLAVSFLMAGFLLAIFPTVGLGQSANPDQTNQTAPVQAPPASVPQAVPPTAVPNAEPQAVPPTTSPDAPPQEAASQEKDTAKEPRRNDRRRAAKLFLEASKLFEKEKFEEAMHDYQRAAALDPSNRNYALAAELASSHAVTALIQAAAKDRIRGDAIGERAALEQALALDPRNIQVTEHLHELGEDAVRAPVNPLYGENENPVGEPLVLQPTPGSHDIHLHLDQRQVIQQVFKLFGVQATVDDSVHLTLIRLDLDDATFDQAMRALSLVTNSFYVPLDPHRVLVARDTQENRRQFQRLDLETIYLPGLTPAELTEVGTIAKTVFELQQATVDPSSGTITLRAATATLDAFNSTIRQLIDGHSQVLLEVDVIQLAHTSDRNTGIQPPQAITAYNVYAEEQSILNANQSLVQQIISSGLAAPGDTLAILGILLASGQVSSSFLTNGVALFGGGLTQSALSPGTLTANFDLNSSDSKELDHMLLRLSDGAGGGTDSAGTIKMGTRYPIQTSSFSSLSAGLSNIPGLTGAGTSGSLSSLLGSLGGSVPNVPQVEYQDLGLSLKATPKVMRNDDVALTIDMKIDALSGSSINGNPILNNRAYTGVITLRKDEGVAILSELDKSEMRAISGLPGLSEIPGLNDITEKDTQKSSSSLLVVMTPHVLRGTQASGHSSMMRVERTTAAR
jgi:tetratricopeptide (TPR) repeat protein